MSKITKSLPELSLLVDKQEINIYIKKIWEIIAEANKYFNDNKPWELKDTDKKTFENILYVTAEIIKQLGIMIYPLMPDTSLKILNFFVLDDLDISIELLKSNIENKKINNIKPLFPRTN